MRRHGRNDKLRKLNAYSVRRSYPYDIGNATDYSRPVYRVRPRGFSTVLFTVEKEPGTATDDFEGFMNTVMELSNIPAPQKKVIP